MEQGASKVLKITKFNIKYSKYEIIYILDKASKTPWIIEVDCLITFSFCETIESIIRYLVDLSGPHSVPAPHCQPYLVPTLLPSD